jgi:uncharacterized protein
MNAPFYKFGLFGDEVSLIVAFVIGIGFGFFLERAGFGNARKLAAQFYLRDLAVLKVMFTAIVTAMVGLYLLSRFGFVDLSQVYLTPTFLVPQIVGGLLLGIGFVIGGYCPGTSVVSFATGRVDGMVYVAGIIAGLLAFGEVYPAIEHFAHITSMGKITLAQLFHVPYGVLVFAVVLMAVGAFVAAEWAEQRFGAKAPEAGSLTVRPWRLTPVRRFALALVVLGAIAAVAGNPYRGSKVTLDTSRFAALVDQTTDHVDASEIADWIIAGRADYTLIDLRSEADYAKYHIPGARNVPLADLTADVAPRTEKIVLYSEGGIHAAQAWLLLKAEGFKAVYSILGGIDDWKNEVLFPAAPADATPKAEAAFERRVQVAKYFGGTPRGASDAPTMQQNLPPPPPPAVEDTTAPTKRKKKEGC